MRKVLAIITVLLYQFGIGSGLVSDRKQTQYLGNPSESSYSARQVVSKMPWDMIIDDGILYIGGGDYNDNTGPVDIHCMDLSTNQWSVSGTLNDEAIGKFIRIGNKIYAPGFDAKGAKSTGNYYWLENGQWKQNSNLPEAAHNYDIIEYDGKLMFAIGAWNNTVSPVQATEDQGNSFYDIPFYKDQINITETNEFDYMRVYDFFETDTGLYCLFLSVTDGKAKHYEFYHYDNGAFHFIATHLDNGIQIKALKQEPIASEIYYRGKCYIAAYMLSRTEDFQNVEHITLPRNEIAVDLLTDEDRLYVLCAQTLEKSCIVRVYTYVYNSFFYPVLSFESENLPISFAKNENTFYIGIGRHGYNEQATGSIITVSVPELTMKLIKDCL